MTSMTVSKKTTSFRCEECGWTTAKWVGRCGECQTWGTVIEVGQSLPRTLPTVVQTPAVPITDVGVNNHSAHPTGVEEFDRVLGGGLTPGSVVLIAGEPGVGKSTLLLDVASRFASQGQRVLYITGEESTAQVGARAKRIGANSPDLLIAAESDCGAALAHIDAEKPALVVVDSIQTLASTLVEGSAGGVTQVREVAGALIAVAKERNIVMLLVGHVTKDGSVAGPRVLEHLVDVVCRFDGERTSRLRFLRSEKNRYGPTDEIGCFDMSDTGIVSLSDPSGLFLSQTSLETPGTCVTITLEGKRPLAVELQALVEQSVLGNPRRASSGIDSSRLAMVLAVLGCRAGIVTAGRDVYTSTVGGVRISEPASDCALALAVASAARSVPIRSRHIVFGEVGLSGEVRAVPGMDRRLAEAARLGFTHAITPTLEGSENRPKGLEIIEVRHLGEAIAAAGIL